MFYVKKFTLIELLIVVSVIGILISILLPYLKGVKEKAQSAVCMSNLKQIGVGVHLNAKDNKNYMPTSSIDSSVPHSPRLIYYTSKYILFELIDKQKALDFDIVMRGTVFDEPVIVGDVKGGIGTLQLPVMVGTGVIWDINRFGMRKSILPKH